MVIYELFCEVLFMWCWWSAQNFLYEGIIMFIIIIIIIRPFCLNFIIKHQNRNWNLTVWYTFTVDHIQYVQQWYHTTITRATQEDLMYCQMSSVTSHSYNLVSGPIRRRGRLMRCLPSPTSLMIWSIQLQWVGGSGTWASIAFKCDGVAVAQSICLMASKETNH